VYEEELADVARAEETFRFVLRVDPADAEALEALDRIYVANGAMHALSEVLKMRVAASEDSVDKVDFSFRLGTVLERVLGRTDQIILDSQTGAVPILPLDMLRGRQQRAQ
jgi:hypothetical protein